MIPRSQFLQQITRKRLSLDQMQFPTFPDAQAIGLSSRDNPSHDTAAQMDIDSNTARLENNCLHRDDMWLRDLGTTSTSTVFGAGSVSANYGFGADGFFPSGVLRHASADVVRFAT
jgi:hypothetical protein